MWIDHDSPLKIRISIFCRPFTPLFIGSIRFVSLFLPFDVRDFLLVYWNSLVLPWGLVPCIASSYPRHWYIYIASCGVFTIISHQHGHGSVYWYGSLFWPSIRGRPLLWFHPLWSPIFFYHSTHCIFYLTLFIVSSLHERIHHGNSPILYRWLGMSGITKSWFPFPIPFSFFLFLLFAFSLWPCGKILLELITWKLSFTGSLLHETSIQCLLALAVDIAFSEGKCLVLPCLALPCLALHCIALHPVTWSHLSKCLRA